jgi:hypothetical protein
MRMNVNNPYSEYTLLRQEMHQNKEEDLVKNKMALLIF